MKKKLADLQPKWDAIFPMLIARRRKLLKLPAGPVDRLQTREFQALIEDLSNYRSSKDLSSREALSAYLLYDWPLRYAEGLSLLKELPKVPARVLEVGAKGAPFSLAALQHGAIEALAVDENELALTCGADLCGHLGYPISIRTCDPSSLRGLPSEGKWDLIVLPYSLFVFFGSLSERVAYIKKLLPLLSEEGHLLIVESSASEVNSEFLAIRDAIADLSLPILAPCLWKGSCPARKHGSSPCFAQRPLENKPFMIKEIQRASKINLNSLKMSYLILSSPEAPPRILPDNLFRVISPPVNTFKGERFFLCGVKGKRTLGTGLKEHPKQSKAFEYLKRGDVIAIENASELDGDLRVTEATSLTLKAPCDKPVS